MSTDQRASNNASEIDQLSPTERNLIALWSEVLHTEELPGPNDDFFELGGDSITMAIAELRIADELSVQLPSGALRYARTVRDLADLIDEGIGAAVHLV